LFRRDGASWEPTSVAEHRELDLPDLHNFWVLTTPEISGLKMRANRSIHRELESGRVDRLRLATGQLQHSANKEPAVPVALDQYVE